MANATRNRPSPLYISLLLPNNQAYQPSPAFPKSARGTPLSPASSVLQKRLALWSMALCLACEKVNRNEVIQLPSIQRLTHPCYGPKKTRTDSAWQLRSKYPNQEDVKHVVRKTASLPIPPLREQKSKQASSVSPKRERKMLETLVWKSATFIHQSPIVHPEKINNKLLPAQTRSKQPQRYLHPRS